MRIAVVDEESGLFCHHGGHKRIVGNFLGFLRDRDPRDQRSITFQNVLLTVYSNDSKRACNINITCQCNLPAERERELTVKSLEASCGLSLPAVIIAILARSLPPYLKNKQKNDYDATFTARKTKDAVSAMDH